MLGQKGGGAITLIISYICRLGPLFGFEILNFNTLGGFQKNEYFWGMNKLWIFFGGHHETGLFWRSFLFILGFFLKVKVQNENTFLGVLQFQIYFLGMPGNCFGKQ